MRSLGLTITAPSPRPVVEAEQAMRPVVRVRHLCKSLGGRLVLSDVNFDVHRGEVLGYLGPNGAGKTTTIRMLMGLLAPSSGKAELFGLDAWRDAARIHASVGYVAGEPALYDRMTGAAFLRFIGRLRRRDDNLATRTLAERLDVDLRQVIRTMSKGNRQKVALIQAFMSNPALLVLDEPTSGLDPLVQRTVHELIGEQVAAGGTVVLSSHVLAEVQQVAHRVAIVRAGRLVAIEPLADLRAEALHHVRVQLTDHVTTGAFAAIPGLRDLTVDDTVVRCSAPRFALDALVKALALHKVVDFSCEEASLEETFLAYYGPEARRAG